MRGTMGSNAEPLAGLLTGGKLKGKKVFRAAGLNDLIRDGGARSIEMFGKKGISYFVANVYCSSISCYRQR